MAIDTTIHRDPATGAVMLTTVQAEAWALYVAAPATADGTQQRNAQLPLVSALERALVADGWDFPELGVVDALARWVLANAPVVRAAEEQADAEGDCLLQHVLQPNDAVGARHLYRAWEKCAAETQAAVRAARVQEADHAE